MSKTKVIIKRPDEKAGHVTSISMSLKNLQKIVEGHIEVMTIGKDPKVVMICNEEGKLRGLERNFRMGGDLADIPIDFKQWKYYLQAWGNKI